MKFLKWIGRVLLIFLLTTTLWVVVYRFLPVPVTFLMLQRCLEQLIDGKDLVLEKEWVSLNSVSPHMKKAVIAAEDQLFFKHSGFDLKAIEKAKNYNKKQRLKNRSKMRGASTISQQTAKNVFLWHSRSWVRKGFEVYFTFLIEMIWGKQRILEVYLNVIEVGDGIYGVEAAASHHFKTSAAKLNASQAAAIAAVLPNPRKWNAARPTPFILRRRAWIERQMLHVKLP